MALQVNNNLNPTARPVVRAVPVQAQAQATATATTPATPATPADLTPEEVKKGLLIFAKGFGVGLLFFLLSLGILSFFKMDFVLRVFLVLVITVLLLWAMDYVLGQKKSSFTGPVIAAVVIAFIILVLIGYKTSSKQEVITNVPTLKSQVLTFEGSEQRVFHVVSGREYTKRVSGAPVNYSNIYGEQVLTQEHGDYLSTANVSGTTAYRGSGASSTVTIEWME